MEKASFERSLQQGLDDSCGNDVIRVFGPGNSKVYGIPPGYRATPMDPTHRLVYDANGVLVNNPEYQKAIDNSKIDKIGVANDLIGIAVNSIAGVAAIKNLTMAGLAMIGVGSATVSDIKTKSK